MYVLTRLAPVLLPRSSLLTYMVSYYAPILFRSIGQSDEMSLNISGALNICQLVAVVVCFLIIDHVGRRPLAVFAAVGMTLPYIVMAALVGIYSKDWASHTAAGWAAVAMSFVYILTYGVSYSPLGWALPPEVFSNAQRAKGGCSLYGYSLVE